MTGDRIQSNWKEGFKSYSPRTESHYAVIWWLFVRCKPALVVPCQVIVVSTCSIMVQTIESQNACFPVIFSLDASVMIHLWAYLFCDWCAIYYHTYSSTTCLFNFHSNIKPQRISALHAHCTMNDQHSICFAALIHDTLCHHFALWLNFRLQFYINKTCLISNDHQQSYVLIHTTIFTAVYKYKECVVEENPWWHLSTSLVF